LEETFRGIKIVKAFTMERHERRRFHQNSKNYYRKAMKIARYDSLTRPVTEVMGVITICLALLSGAYLVLNNETHLFGIRMSERPLSMAALLTFYGMLAGMADPFRKLSEVFSRLQRASAAADRIYTMVDRKNQVRNPRQPHPMPRHKQDLVFDGVDFSYEPEKPILKSINLEIKFGETVALVGPNGCGKSTLASLISRFADPTAGEIRLDGINLKDSRIRDVRGQIGLVSQETLLFDDTIENNIRYGSPLASRKEVIEAARQAYAHQFIETELVEGYQTVAGPLGCRLSGGQRQRIALARAILHNPAILVLDEATSQVDLESEQLIQRALEKFARGRTAVIITHRMGILAMADRIVVMEDGCILDVGSHEELLGRCGLYNRLYNIQFDNTMRESA
jgi:ABC-type multidrug transport system fused ATPase/permease subunit